MILLAAHMDTVFDDGTAAERPFTVDGDRAHGPGVCDDKGGLLAGLTALRLLHESGLRADAELVFVATPDEEIGSPGSAPALQAAARGADCALVLEGARENGDLVLGRKGVADFLVAVAGRAAHAGIEPERGANAALAAAHLVVELQRLNGRWPDVTVNVGVLRAGTRANIVCPSAELRVEVRAATAARIELVGAAMRDLAAETAVEGTTATVTRLDLCPPLEPGDGSRRMLAHARAIGADLGLSFEAVTTGGVGDANHLGALGIPALDGLGPVGGGDHTPGEWLHLAGVPDRVALLAALVRTLGSAAPRPG